MRLSHLALPLLACTALAACGQKSEPAQEAANTAAAPGAAAPAAAPELSAEEKQKLLAALPAPYNAGDVTNGKAKFALCRSCHTIVPGAPNMTGPNLHGVFGRKAGGVADFNYSDAVKNAGFTWDAGQLDQWLAKPKDFLPGTKMTFVGLPNEKDRVDLIAYLMVETGYKPQ
jgi:cytochrome c